MTGFTGFSETDQLLDPCPSILMLFIRTDPDMQSQDLTKKIIGCAVKVHSTLRPGFLESVYQKAMVYELIRAGMKVESGRPVQVYYEGMPVGDFVTDMLVEDRLILELKAIQSLAQAH